MIPLLDVKHAGNYTKVVMNVLIREFKTADDEMWWTVLSVVKQCVGTTGVEAQYIRDQIIPEYFWNFWNKKSTAIVKNSKLLIETTVEIAG